MQTLPIWLIRWSSACLKPYESGLQIGGRVAFRTQHEEYILDLSSGRVLTGVAADAWIDADSDDLERISRGLTNAQALVARKRLEFGGDMSVLHCLAVVIWQGEALSDEVTTPRVE